MRATKLDFLEVLNSVVILMIAAGVGFLSFAFYIGSQEQHEQLMRELPLSFIFRFLSFLAVGILAIIPLVIMNFVLNRTILKGAGKISLKRLVRNGVVLVLFTCLVGNIIFFRLV
jgi:hypothetical protein